MKKFLSLITLITHLVGLCQCPAPSNVTAVNNIAFLNTVELSWTENGSATTWDITAIPNYNIGDPIPENGWISATSNPFIITGIPPSIECYAFFVRSVCSPSDVSSWAAVGSSVCSVAAYNYLATLSTTSFNFNATDDALTVYPNPAKDILNIKTKNNSAITSIIIYNILGQVITSFLTPTNTIAVTDLAPGTYFIKARTDDKDSVIKFIKE